MTEKEQFILHCQAHWTLPCHDTKKAFLALTEDPDLCYFVVRELGMREDYFTDEQEAELAKFIDRMLNNYIIPVKIRTHRIDLTVLTLRLLLSLHQEIVQYKRYRAMVKTEPFDYAQEQYGDYDHE
jgi:hypothetical protein